MGIIRLREGIARLSHSELRSTGHTQRRTNSRRQINRETYFEVETKTKQKRQADGQDRHTYKPDKTDRKI